MRSEAARANMRGAALDRWPNEISHDEGRCIIRRLASHNYVGLRIPSLQVLRAKQPCHIKQAHDTLEAVERMERAGVRDRKWGADRATPEAKRRLAGQKKLQRSWLTRLW